VKRQLEQIEIPGAAEAEERAARLVAAAFGEPRATARARRARGPLVAAAVAMALVAAVLSPPGRAVVNHVRRAVGLDHARSALFSLPAGGKLLVASDSGVWVARPDGSRRLLGRYDEASWSPFGRYVVAARRDELAALESDGSVRWTLARPRVHFPRWAGTATDTRIAYLTGSRLHVVAGDGTADLDIGGLTAAAPVAPAWGSGFGFVLAYADTRGRVTSILTAKGADLWRSSPLQSPRTVDWSSDGTELLVLSHDRVSILRAADGRETGSRRSPTVLAVAFRPGTHDVAELRRPGDVSQVTLAGRVLFSSAGELRGLTWSPDGRWLLTGSPEADQWVFVRADGRKIVAVSNITAQFRSRSFPRVEGWCCSE
jgi:hypothetical protein